MNHPYLPHTEAERRRMLDTLGVSSTEDLLRPIPSSARLAGLPDLPKGLAEQDLLRVLRGLAEQNADLTRHPSFLGAGVYQHHIPAVIDHLAGRAEFYTSYTPYQPEMSQGMLQVIFEFQTMIAELCALPVANASLYDGATALAEAALMAIDATGRRKIIAARTIHPEYRETLATYLRYRGVEIVTPPLADGRLSAMDLPLAEAACLIAGYPNFFGQIEDLSALARSAHSGGALFIAAANPIALGLLAAPGELGADIVIGEGQPLGNPISFGGPSLGFIACREELVRRMPGRLVGQTVDHDGRRGFVLTLQTREQHIRREKATSNICSNAALLALRACIYLAAAGPAGLREVAANCSAGAHYALDRLTAGGRYQPLFTGPFFHEFAVRCPVSPARINSALWQKGIIGGLDLGSFYPEFGHTLLLAVTELRTVQEIEELAATMEAIAC